MDKIIKYINNHPEYGMTLKYSTPSIYLDAVHSTNLTWSLNKYDFFPYADIPHAYWSGYFTSRPSSKGYIRSRGNVLRATDKLLTTSLAQIDVDIEDALAAIDVLDDAYGVTQHHDAVAGTEKQHVADDYAKRLYIGTESVEQLQAELFGKLVANGNAVPQFTFCPLINESICPALMALKNEQSVPMVMYNPLGWQRTYHVRLPVPIANVDSMSL
jgi:hypothetical protein